MRRKDDERRGGAPRRAVAVAPAPSADGAGRGEAAPTPFAAAVAQLYARSGMVLRIRLLKALLPAVRPLALTVIGAGVFARYLGRARWEEVPVSLEDAARFSVGQIMELALYVEQSHPGWVAQASTALSQSPATLPAAGAALVALAFGMFVERRGTTEHDAVDAD
jgi:hypothetical protein